MNKTLDHLLARSRQTRTKPALPMTAFQLAARDRVLRKYADGTYKTIEVPCLCGSPDGLVVAELDRYGLPSPSVLCRACGIVRTSPRLTDDSLADFYENDYRPFYEGAAGPSDYSLTLQSDSLTLQRCRGENISRFVGRRLAPESRIVDIGCGNGFTLLAFQETGHRVAGCDLGSTYLEAGRARGLDLRHGDHTTLTDLAPFDLVILSQVFEHLTDPRKLMEELRPMLAPGGLVYIEVPGLKFIPKTYADPLRYFQNAHLWNFDLGSLSGVMAGCGYRRVEGDEYIRSIFTPESGETSRVPGCPADPQGYDRAVQALTRAEAMRRMSEARRDGLDLARKIIGRERASKLKKKLLD